MGSEGQPEPWSAFDQRGSYLSQDQSKGPAGPAQIIRLACQTAGAAASSYRAGLK